MTKIPSYSIIRVAKVQPGENWGNEKQARKKGNAMPQIGLITKSHITGKNHLLLEDFDI